MADTEVVSEGAFVDRYVVLRNEPDPEVRRKLIRELWAPEKAQDAALRAPRRRPGWSRRAG
jgi:hypothetical protein